MMSVETKTKELFRKHDHRGVRTRISADKNTPCNTVVFLAHVRLYFNAFILGTPSSLRICDIKKKSNRQFIYQERIKIYDRAINLKKKKIKYKKIK